MSSKNNPLFACAVTNVDGQAVTELPPRGKTHLRLTFTDLASGEPLKGMIFELRTSRGRSTSLRLFDERGDGHRQMRFFGGLEDGTVVVKIGCTNLADQLTISFIVEPMYRPEDAHPLKKDYGALTVSFNIVTPVKTEEDSEDPMTAPSPISYLPPPPGLTPPRQVDDLSDLSEAGWNAFAEYANEVDVLPAEEADEEESGDAVVQLSFLAPSEDGWDELQVIDETPQSPSPLPEVPPRVIEPLTYHEVDSRKAPATPSKWQTGHERATVRLCSPNGSAAPTVPYSGMSEPMIIVVMVDGAPCAETNVLLSFSEEENTGLAFKDADGHSDGNAPEEVLLKTDAYGRTPAFRLAHNGLARKRMVSLFVDYGKMAIGVPVLIVPIDETITLETEEVVVDPPTHTPWDDHSPKVRSDPRPEASAPTSVEATVDPDSAPPATASPVPAPPPEKVAAVNGIYADAKPKPSWAPRLDPPIWFIDERHQVHGGYRRHDDVNDPFFQHLGPNSNDRRERTKERLRALEPETFDPSVWVLCGTIGLIVTLIVLCGLGLGYKHQRWDKMTVGQQSELVETVWGYAEPVVEKLTEQLATWDRKDNEKVRAEKEVKQPPDPVGAPPVVAAPEPIVEPAPPVVVEVKPEPLPSAPPVVTPPTTPPPAIKQLTVEKIPDPRPDPIWVPGPKGVPLYPPTHYPVGPKPKAK